MKKIIIISADGFEDLELFYPYHRLKEEGFNVIIASNKERITGKHGYAAKADKLFKDVDPVQFDGLVIPGGKGPEIVRLDDDALKIVKHFIENNKPVAFICHGVQVLISANALKGRKATCWYGVKDDLIAAGGTFLDQEVVVDGNFVSSRHPGDLASWMREFIKLLKTQ
ncbi:MAG: peptidase [Candidatus Asgardarchaeum californiense]|nr:MAG: peptidase [Candidatus Asgardarchaeum californiense]